MATGKKPAYTEHVPYSGVGRQEAPMPAKKQPQHSSASPRATRASTENPEKHAKGKAKSNMKPVPKHSTDRT